MRVLTMRRRLAAAGLAGLLLWAAPAASRAASPVNLQVLADSFAPLQYAAEDGKPAGYVHAYMQELLQHAGRQLELRGTALQLLPLKRALALAQAQPNVLILSLARTPEREHEFHWLAEVAPYQLWLYKSRRALLLPPLRSLAELKGRGLRIGVQDKSNFHEWLLAQGLGQGGDNTAIDAVHANARNLPKAQLGRIDLFAHPDISLAYRAHEQGLQAEDFVPVLPIVALSNPLWLAASHGSDLQLLQALQRSHAALQAQGRLEALRRQELARFHQGSSR